MNIELERRKLRFIGKYKIMSNGCWEWQAGTIKKDYGKPYGMFFWGTVDGKELNMQAHRAAWLLFRGPIPKVRKDEGCILHRCNNPPCVNPDHLYIGTHKENAADRDAAGHTSRGAHRYNYKRSATLIADIKAAFLSGLNAQQTCDKLGIGWQTLYRARAQDTDLRRIMAETKSARYAAGARKR